MKKLFGKAFLVFMFIALFTGTNANATVTGYSDRVSFDADVTGALVETWDGFSAGTTFANGSTVNGITYNSSNGNALVTDVFLASTDPNTLGEVVFGFFPATDSMTFGFPTSILAFGIDINTFATAEESYKATTNLGDIAFSGFDPFPGFDTGQFVGFVSDTPISSVTISAASSAVSDSYTLDTLRYAPVTVVPIPEPSTMFLLGAGLVGLWRARRKFKK